MNVICQWCTPEDDRVPLNMFVEHLHLIHSDLMARSAAEQHGGDDIDELKAAYWHLCAAQAQCDRSDYSTGREYKIISEKLEFLIGDLGDLMTMAERFQR